MVNKDGEPIEDLYVALKQNHNVSGSIFGFDARVFHVKNPVLIRFVGRTFLTGDSFRYWDGSGSGEMKTISQVWLDFFEVNVFTENEIDLKTGQPMPDDAAHRVPQAEREPQ